jgi:hypothetical protein
MERSGRTTRCPTWYELNLAGLRVREVYRSAGVGGAVLGLFLWRIPGLFGARIPAGLVFPAEVTLVREIDVEDLEEQDDLLELGFRPLGAYELPELSGENDTLLLRDPDRTTYCEVVCARAKGTTQFAMTFHSYLAGEREMLLKTVQSRRTSPLDRPEEYPCQCVSGTAEEVYEGHRKWVDSFGGELVPTSFDHFLDAAARDHRTLMKHWAKRGLYVTARPHLVRKLLKDKGLKQPRDED